MNIRYKRLLSAMLAVSVLMPCPSCASVVEQAGSSSGMNEDSTGAEEEASAAPGDDGEQGTAPAGTDTAETKTEGTTETAVPDVMRGNIYDAHGELLAYSKHDSDGKEVRVFTEDYKVAFANVLSEMSEGMDTIFEEQLRKPNPSPVDGDEKVGQSVQLTFDSDLQKGIYDYMAYMGLEGAAVVMRADGSLAAQVSCPSYDPDEYAGKKHDEDLAWGTYGNKAFQNAEPGSTFKMMSEVLSDKHGIYSLWDEGEWYDDGATIVNWDHDKNKNYPMQRSLYSAFINSSNIYFAKAFDQIGKKDVLDDLDKIFRFITPIDCDFGEIHNNVEMYCNDDLRRTAFGQSYVLTCPIYLAALCHEAGLGDMYTPFVLKNTVDTNDFSKVLEKGSKSFDKIASIPEEYRENLWAGMLGVANDIGVWVPDGYTLYAKTGTAETWMGDFLYITGCLKTEKGNDKESADYTDYKGSYVVVMQIRNPESFGFNFASESVSLYQGIVNALCENVNKKKEEPTEAAETTAAETESVTEEPETEEPQAE
ncbi:MAG: peptidoglycan glycosyltransferase [Ruminococcus sp.]|nr:peptidoglycan glycosyltransferase [Ruminococcus sp.]